MSGGGVAIDAGLIAWGAAACNLVVTAFLFGAVYGRLTSKIAATAREVEVVKASVDLVNRKLATPEGEPLLLSYKAHDHICTRANDRISAELRHVVEAIAAHSAAVSNCGEQVSQLTVAVAILEEKFAHERQSTR